MEIIKTLTDWQREKKAVNSNLCQSWFLDSAGMLLLLLKARRVLTHLFFFSAMLECGVSKRVRRRRRGIWAGLTGQEETLRRLVVGGPGSCPRRAWRFHSQFHSELCFQSFSGVPGDGRIHHRVWVNKCGNILENLCVLRRTALGPTSGILTTFC